MVAALRERAGCAREEPYVHSVPFSHRSGERIEPLISLQWFCRMDELAAPAIEVVRDEVRIVPGAVEARLPRLDAEIRPWCVSRQLWWGHQIPVWYCDDEDLYVGMEPPQGHHWQVERNVTPTWYAAHGARGAPGRKRTHSISQAYWPTTPSVTPSQARSRQ